MSSGLPHQRNREWYEVDGGAGGPGAVGAGSQAYYGHQPAHAYDQSAPPPGIAGRGPRATVPVIRTPREVVTHAPIGLPRALGVPPAGSAYRRSRVASPFDMQLLPSIERSSVVLWDLLRRHVPHYLRSQALGDGATAFIQRVLSPDEAQGAEMTLDVRRIEDGSTEGHKFSEPEITIGTHATSKLQLSGAAVSRRHVRLVREAGACQLVDQGSSNGTFLRGEKIQSGYAYPLRNNETFSIPGHEITVRWSEEAPAPKLKSLRLGSLRIEPAQTFLQGAPRGGLMAAVRAEPGGARMLVEIDMPLAHLLAARILGGAGGQLSAGQAVPLRPLGEVDKGVVELLMVKLLDEIQREWGSEAEVTLHLERLYDAADPQLQTLLGQGDVVTAAVGLSFDSRRDTVRVVIPRAALDMLGERFERDVERAGSTIQELYQRFRGVIGFAHLELACCIGEMRVSRRELKQLEQGAICFPDELSLVIEGDAVQGEVELAPAFGGGGMRVKTRLAEFGPVVRVEITEFCPGPAEPGAEDGSAMTEQEAAASAEEIGEGVAMLEEVPMAVVVELGRLSLTVRDLAALRRGQVVELGRGAEDPVNLVVDGHLVGTGKLVNVEGEIGVQILDLLR